MTKQKTRSMYRQAALEAHFMQQYGKASLMPKLKHVLLCMLLVCWVVIAIAFMSTRALYETIEVNGWVQSEVPNINVRSQAAAGTITEVYVQNGEVVTAGQKIAKIARSKGMASSEHDIAQTLIEHKNQRQNQVSIFEKKLKNADQEARHIKKLIQSRTAQLSKLDIHTLAHLEQTHKSHERYQDMQALVKLGTIAKSHLAQNELQILSLQQGKLDLAIQKQNIQNTLIELEQRLYANATLRQQTKHELAIFESKTEQNRKALESELFYFVRAPKQGKINHLQAHIGASIGFSQSIAQIVPQHTQYTVTLAMPSYQAAFIEREQQVSVKVDGFPYQQYGSLSGIIQSVAQDVLMPEDARNIAIPTQSPVYLIDVDLVDTPPSNPYTQIMHQSLRSGMPVKATINKRQTTIVKWLFAPLIDSLSSEFTDSNGVYE